MSHWIVIEDPVRVYRHSNQTTIAWGHFPQKTSNQQISIKILAILDVQFSKSLSQKNYYRSHVAK